MELIATRMQGCFQLVPQVQTDSRGYFVKTFHSGSFEDLGIPTDWREEYYSSSHYGVIRGMHFQNPPHDHSKLVYCLRGKVLDVLVDLRVESPTYRQHISFELDSSKMKGVVIPQGLAHGFLALTEDALMAYKVTSLYSPSHDAGIRWDSIGFDWGVSHPIVSERDKNHPALSDFTSPF